MTFNLTLVNVVDEFTQHIEIFWQHIAKQASHHAGIWLLLASQELHNGVQLKILFAWTCIKLH